MFTFSDLADGLEDGVKKVEEFSSKFEATKEPIKAGIDLFGMIVDSKKEGVSIDNISVMSILETIAKSTANDLDDSILNTVRIALRLKF